MKTLVIGDSFYWSLYLHEQFSDRFLDNGEFWYYFNRVMWNGKDDGSIKDVRLPDDLLSYQQVILFETESHYHRLSNGFLAAAVAGFVTGPTSENSIVVAEEDSNFNYGNLDLFTSPESFQINRWARRMLQGMASPFQDIQQSTTVDLNDPKGGA